jgi:hypothetical protein
MLPHTHLLAGSLVSTLSYRLDIIDPSQALVLAGLSVAIDADHYILFLVSKKDAHPVRCWNASIKREAAAGRSFLHDYLGLAILVPLLALAMVLDFGWGYALLAAYLTHLVLDKLPDGILPMVRFAVKGMQFRISYLEMIADVILIMGLLLV